MSLAVSHFANEDPNKPKPPGHQAHGDVEEKVAKTVTFTLHTVFLSKNITLG